MCLLIVSIRFRFLPSSYSSMHGVVTLLLSPGEYNVSQCFFDCRHGRREMVTLSEFAVLPVTFTLERKAMPKGNLCFFRMTTKIMFVTSRERRLQVRKPLAPKAARAQKVQKHQVERVRKNEKVASTEEPHMEGEVKTSSRGEMMKVPAAY